MVGYRARMPARPTGIGDDAFMLRIEDAQGARVFDVAEGAVYRRDAGVEHTVVDAGTALLRFIEIGRT